MKAKSNSEAEHLEQVPNIGRAIADDLRLIGVQRPAELSGQDPYVLYENLNAATGVRQDPCVLDTFIAAVRFMDGGPSMPWWSFTGERKQALSGG